MRDSPTVAGMRTWGSGRLRVGLSLAAVVAGLVVAQPNAGAAPFAPSCADGWDVSTVVSGGGEIENLDSDGAGGFYFTRPMAGELLHVNAAGRIDTLAGGFDKPAGVRMSGGYVYFVTGDDFSAAPGTLQRYDLDTRELTTLVTGLNMPNGLLALPDGDLLIATTAFTGEAQGISRYRPATGEFIKGWSNLPAANGMALAEDGRSIYASNMTMRVFRIPLDAPHTATVVTGLPQLITLPDDMDATRAGTLFLADHAVGALYQVDTATGAACSVITGLVKPAAVRVPPDGATSVRIARDGAGWSLFVTSMDGTLRRLRPPPDIDLTPVSSRN